MNQTDQLITTLPHIFCGCALAPTCLFLCCFPESAWDLLQFCPPTAVFGKGRMGTYIIWNHLWIGLNSHVHYNPPSPGFSSLWLKFELAQTSCKKNPIQKVNQYRWCFLCGLTFHLIFFLWTWVSWRLNFPCSLKPLLQYWQWNLFSSSEACLFIMWIFIYLTLNSAPQISHISLPFFSVCCEL